MHNGMDFSSLLRGCRQGISRLRRAPGSFDALLALSGLLLLSQCLLLTVVGLEGGMRFLEEKAELRIDILEQATDSRIQDVFQALRGLPIVSRVTYVTREQALESMKQRDPDLVSFITTFGVKNPFPETLRIRLQSLSMYPKIISVLKGKEFADTIDPSTLSVAAEEQRRTMEHINIIDGVHTLALVGIGLLALVIFLVLSEIIRGRTSSHDLSVLTLAGTSRAAMLSPFFFEAFFLLLPALLLSCIAAGIGVALLPHFFDVLRTTGPLQEWAAVSLAHLGRLTPLIAGLEFLFILLLSLLSLGSIPRYATHTSR